MSLEQTQLTRVKVDKTIFWKGLAHGRDQQNNSYIIENGDLFLGQNIDVYITGKRYAKIPQFNFDLQKLTAEFGDDDELIQTKKLKELRFSKENDRIFELGDYWITPDREIYGAIELLLQDKSLWTQARIRVSNKSRQTVRSRVQSFGIDFTKAIEKVIQTKKEYSYFYCENKKEFETQGAFADFLVLLNTTKRSVIELQCWQAFGQDEILTYAHGEIDNNRRVFIHFDCAKHFSTLGEIEYLFRHKNKLNRNKKRKYFRLDGEIDYESIFRLMKTFFPLDNLIDEYYNVE
jgi:hypothetical protein